MVLLSEEVRSPSTETSEDGMKNLSWEHSNACDDVDRSGATACCHDAVWRVFRSPLVWAPNCSMPLPPALAGHHDSESDRYQARLHLAYDCAFFPWMLVYCTGCAITGGLPKRERSHFGVRIFAGFRDFHPPTQRLGRSMKRNHSTWYVVSGSKADMG
jgi:hypothetical protein